ncbi:uncharacterized protein K489DRAFT_370681 [Dissoconium aciculare CBS 342.82]|uniref:Uncharacterized protein n=1 Tax=Dissoconium aciculare CBS 342.82 TaxID=1314786 RepID=A0A6J3M4Y4_9PEZI|nr:uncharacterized protein K489DRAFT_370681 [Dissoconium aciculare CBS 342.82]KAF1823096.1 hypothetical protein K489DRAFT_370681 [Dissoconium aciculare CBS 342.82]
MARAKASAARKTSDVPITLAASRTRRGKAAASSTQPSIANTSDIDDDEDDLITVAQPTVQRRVMEAVVIPVIRRSASGKLAIDSASNSSVEAASIANTSMESSPDYETPATTPGDLRSASKTTKRKRSALDQCATPSSNKATASTDEALAVQLQEEEYDYFQAGSSKRARVVVDDSDDIDSVLSEPMSIDSVQPAKRQSSTKQSVADREVVGRRTSRRATRNTTEVSTSAFDDEIEEAIDDSELSELEELSEFEDDEASAVGSEDEELENSDMEPAGPVAAAEDATESEQASAQAPARRRRRGRQSVNSRNGNSTEARRQRFRARFEAMRLSRKDRERQKLEKSHPEIKTMWNDLEKIPVLKPDPVAQPVSINRQLKSYQLEGVAWMIAQEKSHYKGGLLGDEMGMGKTIQAVSLIMSDWPQKQPTLVVVPPVALMQWSAEITEYTDGKLKVLVYHGQNSKVKNMSLKDLKKFDVIMISYNSLESLYRKETKGWSRGEDIVKEDSLIHAMHFHRLILDEAHSIKSRTTGVAKACFALKGTYKWCLSGTPVQNRIGEFFSLLRFLEVRPFADYFCKRCPCSILHWELDVEHMCKGCKHSGMEHVSVFNQELLNPLTQSEEVADRHKAMEKLYLITARIMLRRMKRDYVSSMELPPKEVVVHNEFFGEIERDFSSSIMSNTARQFDTYVSRGVMLNNYANIFGLIMQMRQVANHPDLLLKKHAAQGQNVLVCNICDEVAEEAIRSKCKHDFCRACVKSYVQSVEENDGEADCPRCHIPLSIDFDQPEIEQDEDVVKKSSIINRINMKDWTSSTKIEMLIYDLWKLRSKKQTLKSIVFSQFTSMLQLIEWRLRRAGFNTVMLDGSMTPIQRQKSIEHFMTNPDVEIFLVSLKAGGVALNLTEASRVFIVDPWWNPAAEWQSADRCHRIGQKRPCVITRLCIEDSVESRMVLLQEKKANMINGTINNDKTSMEKLTPEDMEFLFRGT